MQRRSELAPALKRSILAMAKLGAGGMSPNSRTGGYLGMSITPSAGDLNIECPKLRRLHQDWQDRRRGREMPSRKDFDVLDFAYILGDLNLFDVLYEPLRFRFRVHGTNAVGRLGFDLTGKTVDDYPDPEYGEMAKGHYTEAINTRLPIRVLRDPFRFRARVLRWEGLILPLSADGARVDMLLVGISLL